MFTGMVNSWTVLDSKGTDDRLPILVSGLNGTKFPGVPSLSHLKQTDGPSRGDLIDVNSNQGGLGQLGV